MPRFRAVTWSHEGKALLGRLSERSCTTSSPTSSLTRTIETHLLSTYEALLALKPTTRPQKCPYEESHGCAAELTVGRGLYDVPRGVRPVYSTDALRIHERFRDIGTNGEAFGLVMQVMERLLLVHFLRCFERRNLDTTSPSARLLFDGPLAVFGPPAWLSAAVIRELKRLNQKVQEATGQSSADPGNRVDRGFRAAL